MAAASEVHIKLRTSADTTGIRQVEEAHEKLWQQMRDAEVNALTEQLGLNQEEADAARKVLDTVRESVEELAEGLPENLAEFAKQLEAKVAPALAEIEKKVLARREAEYQAHRKKMEAWKREELARERAEEEENFRARMARNNEDVQMQRALAAAEQMRREQQIVANTPDYNPADDARRWRDQASGLDRVHSAARRTSGGIGGLNQVLAQASYLADDAQYGFRAIANNLSMLALAVPGIGGALAVAIPLVGMFLRKVEEADNAKLENLRREADLTKEAFERLGETLRETFEKDLARWKEEIQKALGSYTQSLEVLSKQKGRVDAQAQAELDLELARLEARKMKEMNVAPESKDHRRIVEERYADEEAKLRRKAEQDSLRREIAHRERNLEVLERGKKTAEEQMTASKEAALSAPAARQNIRERMIGIGALSDQDKTLADFDAAQREVDAQRQMLEKAANEKIAMTKSGEYLVNPAKAMAVVKHLKDAEAAQNRAMETVNAMRERARVATEEAAAGKFTYEGAKKGEGLTAAQQGEVTKLLHELEAVNQNEKANAEAVKQAAEKLAQIAEQMQAEKGAVEVAQTRQQAAQVREQTAGSEMRVGQIPMVATPPSPNQIADHSEWGQAQNQVEAALRDASKRTGNQGVRSEIAGLLQRMGDGTSEEEMKMVAERIGTMLGKRNEAVSMLAEGVTEFANWLSDALGHVQQAQRAMKSAQKSVVPRG
jgi:hypothetical protein